MYNVNVCIAHKIHINVDKMHLINNKVNKYLVPSHVWRLFIDVVFRSYNYYLSYTIIKHCYKL